MTKLINEIALIAIFTVGIGSTVFTQPTGFQGKRLIIGLEVASGPTFTFINNYASELGNDYSYLEYFDENGYPVLNTKKYSIVGFVFRPTLYFEYILNRKSTIQVLGRYFTRNVDIESYSGYSNASPTFDVTYFPTERSKATFFSGGLRYKFYINDALAPLGTYQTAGIEYNLMQYNFSDQNFATHDDWRDQTEYRNPEQTKTSRISVSYGIGIEQAFGNSFLMNFGIEGGITFNVRRDYTNQRDSKEYADILGGTQIIKNSIFNVVIGFALAP